MGALDEAFQAMADSMIGSLVDTLSAIKRTTEAYTPSTGATTRTNSTYSVKASPPFPFKQRQYDGASILAGDMQVIVPALSLEIVPSPATDTFQDGPTGKVYRIVAVEPLRGGDAVAAYLLQVRA